jgi:hypothetical protein
MPYYLGKHPQGDWVLFSSACIPTKETHGHLYTCAQGPFRTRLAARWFNRYGRDNPHVCTMADAERLAHEAARENPIMEQWLVEEGMSTQEREEAYAFEAYEQGVDTLTQGVSAIHIRVTQMPVTAHRVNVEDWHLESAYEDRVCGMEEA